MAQGDVTLFNTYLQGVEAGTHAIGTATFKVGLVNNTTVPSATTADPRWGAGGTTNFATNQVSAGGNYTSGGTDITLTVSQPSAGTVMVDPTTNPSWAKAAGGPTGIYWGIIYNDTASGKPCVGAVEIGTNVSNVDSDVSITWNANGLYRKALKGVL